jgi:hypothetical protein
VHERLESQRRNGRTDGANVIERVLSREHDTSDAKLQHHPRARLIVDGRLRGSMNLELGIDRLNQPNEPEVLHDDGIDAAIDSLTEERERVDQLGRLDQDVEREVDAPLALVSDAASFGQLVERQLRAFVACVEPRGAEVDGIGSVGHSGANGVE